MNGAIHVELPLDRPWAAAFTSYLNACGIGYEPVFGVVELAGVELVAALHDLGCIDPAGLPVTWSFRGGERPQSDRRRAYWLRGLDVVDVHGAFSFSLDGCRCAAGVVGTGHNQECVLAADSQDRLFWLAQRVFEADAARRRRGLQIYGGEGHGFTRREPEPVAEDAIVLPPELKRDLLTDVDAFAGRVLREPERTAHRGLLLLGRPGTGKTLMARHLLHRFQGFRKYLFVCSTARSSAFDDRTFEGMVHAIDTGTDPALVIIEDVDRMFDHGTTTAQYFLNVLDGLLEPSVPALWIVTSNDPSRIAPNLLDRPGRFERVFLFPVPDTDRRVELFRLYAMDELDEEQLQGLAEGAAGLTGAHIREVCESAAVRAGLDSLPYHAAADHALERMKTQHVESRRYARELAEVVAGFGRG